MSWIRLTVGSLVVIGVLALASYDGRRIANDWSTMGPLGPGVRIDNLEIERLEGGVLTAADLRGSVSVLTFWATWCGACAGELDDLTQMQPEYDAQAVQFVAVNVEGGAIDRAEVRRRVRRYRDDRDLDFQFAIDNGRAARKFGVGPIPHTMLIDGDGVVRYVHQGRVSQATLAEELASLR